MTWLFTIILVMGTTCAILNAVGWLNNLVQVISFILVFLGGAGLTVLQLVN